MNLKKCFIVTTLIFIACVTYRPTPGFRLRGAEINVESKYSYSNEGYSVYAYCIHNIAIKSTVTISDTFMDEITNLTTIHLTRGQKNLLYIYGCDTAFNTKSNDAYIELYPSFILPPKTYEFIFLIDSMKQNDTILLNSSAIQIIEYQFNRNGELNISNDTATELISSYEHSGYTTDLNGYLYINTISTDSLIGVLSFSGITKGYYYIKNNDILIPDLESKISSAIIFTAVRKKMNNIKFLRTIAPFRFNDDYME